MRPVARFVYSERALESTHHPSSASSPTSRAPLKRRRRRRGEIESRRAASLRFPPLIRTVARTAAAVILCSGAGNGIGPSWVDPASPAGRNSSALSSPRGERSSARSSAFFSSRIFPGQGWLERALLLSPRGELSADEFLPAGDAGSTQDGPIPFPAPLHQITAAAVRATVRMSGGNRSEAARRLSISPRRLRRLLSGALDVGEDADEGWWVDSSARSL